MLTTPQINESYCDSFWHSALKVPMKHDNQDTAIFS